MDLKLIVEDKIYNDSLLKINLNKRCIINTINPHSYCVAKGDREFEDALFNSDVLLPDGTGIVLATKVLVRKKIVKIAGADIHQFLLEQANLKTLKVFYLGASQSTLYLIHERIKKEFPKIKFASYSPPYKVEFTKKDSNKMITEINTFKPDILFVGMTAPKQEKWVFRNKDKINAQIIASIGAVFDFYAGTVKRSGPIWIKLGLEWLPRLVREPKRLWKRNFISTPIFLVDVLKAKYL